MGTKNRNGEKSFLYCLKSLPDTSSKFNIISLGSLSQSLFKTCVEVNEKTIEQAINKVRGFRADMKNCNFIDAFEYIEKIARHSKLKTRVFVLTDGAIYNPNDCLAQVEKTVNEIDIRYYSLGIGNGCSEMFIKGIATKGIGEYEFSINEIDLIEKMIYLLESSMRYSYTNTSISLPKNDNRIISNINSLEQQWKDKRINKSFSIYGIIPKEVAQQNLISFTCSIEQDVKNVTQQIHLDLSQSIRENFLHKFIIGIYSSTLEHCKYYQVLSNETSLLCIIEDPSLTKEEMKNKYLKEIQIVKIKKYINIKIKDIFGEISTFEVLNTTTISELIEIIKAKTQKTPNKLYLSGKLLENHQILEDLHIKENDTLTVNFCLTGKGMFYDFPIIVNGKKYKEVQCVNLVDPFKDNTYEEIRKDLCLSFKLKEEEYDFLAGDIDITKKTGKLDVKITEINIIKKVFERDLTIEEKLVKNQKLNGLWKVDPQNLKLLNFTVQKWKSFLQKNEKLITSLYVGKDEVIIFNMLIICFINKCYKRQMGKFKLLLHKTKKQILKKNSNYSDEKQKKCNDAFKNIFN